MYWCAMAARSVAKRPPRRQPRVRKSRAGVCAPQGPLKTASGRALRVAPAATIVARTATSSVLPPHEQDANCAPHAALEPPSPSWHVGTLTELNRHRLAPRPGSVGGRVWTSNRPGPPFFVRLVRDPERVPRPRCSLRAAKPPCARRSQCERDDARADQTRADEDGLRRALAKDGPRVE